MLGALVRFDLYQRFFADRLRGRSHPPRTRSRRFLDSLLYRSDFLGIRFDLFQFRGPFDVDRNCRSIAGAGRGIHLRRRLLGIFAHLLVFKRRTLNARFLVRTAGRPDVLGHRSCRYRLELGSSRCQPRGRCCRLVRWTTWLSLRRIRVRPAYGLSAAAFPLALLLTVAAAAAAPSAPSFTLLAVLARWLLVLRHSALRLLLLRLLLPWCLALGMLPIAVVSSLVVSILLVAMTPAVALLLAVTLVVLPLTALLPAFRLAIAASAVPVAAFVPSAVLGAFRKRRTRSAFGRHGGRR